MISLHDPEPNLLEISQILYERVAQADSQDMLVFRNQRPHSATINLLRARERERPMIPTLHEAKMES